MKRTFIAFCLIVGVGLAGCSDSPEKAARKAPVAKAPKAEVVGQTPTHPKPETAAEPGTDHHKISFDGYRIGDKFEDKGYKGNPFIHENPQYHRAEWGSINQFSMLTLQDGTIAAISKTYFVDGLKDFADKFSIKSDIALKPEIKVMGVASKYRGEGKDLIVEITTEEPSRYIEQINDMSGKIVVDVASPALIKKWNEEVEAKKRAALEKAAADFEF